MQLSKLLLQYRICHIYYILTLSRELFGVRRSDLTTMYLIYFPRGDLVAFIPAHGCRWTPVLYSLNPFMTPKAATKTMLALVLSAVRPAVRRGYCCVRAVRLFSL